MTPAEVARRRRYTTERSWTLERVDEASIAAWCAYLSGKKTEEHAKILNWAAVLLVGEPYETRRAVQWRGMTQGCPGAYRLSEILAEAGCPKSTYEDRWRAGSSIIAKRLNERGE